MRRWAIVCTPIEGYYEKRPEIRSKIENILSSLEFSRFNDMENTWVSSKETALSDVLTFFSEIRKVVGVKDYIYKLQVFRFYDFCNAESILDLK